jgi:protein involved in polysaccharide export with SLBB domain
MKTALALLALLPLTLAPGAWAGPPSTPTNSAPSGGEVADESYRIVPLDRIAFKNDTDPSPNNTTQVILVTSRGDLEIPVSRGYDERVVVHANGRTIAEVKKDLQARLEAQYYKTTKITLSIESNAVHPGTVVFYGEIKGNMQLPAGQPRYLSESILDMKPSEFANLKNVQLVRHDSVTGKTKTITVNVEEILNKGLKEKDYVLQDGDHVIIKAKFLNFK